MSGPATHCCRGCGHPYGGSVGPCGCNADDGSLVVCEVCAERQRLLEEQPCPGRGPFAHVTTDEARRNREYFALVVAPQTLEPFYG